MNPGDVDGLDYQTDLVISGLAARHAGRFTQRHRDAIVAGDDRLDWATLDERVHRLAGALAAGGVGHGTVIGLHMRNRAEFFEIVLALAELGAVAAPQSFRSTAHELVHGLQATGATLLFTEEGELAERAAAALATIADPPAVVVLPAGGAVADHVPVVEHPTTTETRPAEHDAIWLASTGGTSGPPKLVRVPHRVLVQMWLFMAIEFGIGRHDTMLIPGPLHHGLGFGFALQQLYVGGRVAVLGDFDPSVALRTIARERVTIVPAAPTILNMLLDHPDCAATDLSSVRTIVSAGSPLMTNTKLRLLERLPGVQLYEHYGATEAGFFTVLGPEDQLRKERSCGTAFFGSEMRVTDDDGRVCAPGEIGLVVKRGLVQGGGYVGNAQATARMFRDGWATVGDLGYVDDEGYLYLVDRQSDVIVSGGVNVYPAEIEAAIAAMDGVDQVAVIGVPDERWGETVKAFVVRRPGATIGADDVVEACAALLAAYKRPRQVEFVDDLPKSAAGKILKRELRAVAWAGHERSVG